MNFLDTNILASAFYTNPDQDSCQSILREGGVTTSLALIETFNVLERVVSRDHATEAVRSLLKLNLRIVDVDVNLVFESLKRTTRYKLRFPDPIHYTSASATLAQCKKIVSYDKDFDHLDIPRIQP